MSPMKSPVRVTVYPSPTAGISRRTALSSDPNSSQFSLRQSKQQARNRSGVVRQLTTKSTFVEPVEFSEPAENHTNGDSEASDVEEPIPAEGCLPGRIPPPSLRHQQRWKVKSHSESATCSSSQFVIDEYALPVIRKSSSNLRATHGYVTRSLFHDSSAEKNHDLTASSNCADLVNGVSSAAGFPKVVGVEKAFFTDLELLGSDSCDSEYLCCELVSEFGPDENNVSQVQVRLFHSGLTVETLSSCCSFDAKFMNCPNHVPGNTSTVSGVQTAGITSVAAELLEPNILSQPFSSDSEDEWCDVEVPEDSVAGSDCTSDWEAYAAEICEEDLPRLGVVKLDAEFHADPFEWRMADEYWGSHRVQYSHDTQFKGGHAEGKPQWFGEYLDPATSANLRPVDIFNKAFLLDIMRMVCRETNRYAARECESGSESENQRPKQLSHAKFLLSIADDLVKGRKGGVAAASRLRSSQQSLHHSKHGETRRNCSVCGKLTKLTCPKCNWKPMCLGDCYLDHHEDPDCCSGRRSLRPRGWRLRDKGISVGARVSMVGVKRVSVSSGVRHATAWVQE
ncbi:hypothetical protein R1sor_027350 [Riccia sorocarpa]|uniref:HIT-type domain-containing protein n=1 Tax=Riccia sorocarpa TaxID=122646 RepID=A0ABD3GDX8_9MARC